MQIDTITIFPAMLDGILAESIMKRAVERKLVRFSGVDLRDFTSDRHRTTDDRPYGGGPGMLMKPEPIFKAVESIRSPASHVVLMSPQGTPFSQSIAHELTQNEHLIFVCGHYEGVDERVREAVVDRELSIGDYVLTNGVVAAAVVIDAVVRLLPGVLGAAESTQSESFSEALLEYPQYTRPVEFRGLRVPEVLQSGDHQRIAAWRREQSILRTRARRPDLLS